MNKLPLSTALLSVVAAIVLWYLATILEGDRSWLDAPPRNVEPAEFGRRRTDSPVHGGAAALRCEQTERKLQDRVDTSRYCVSDGDCTIFDYGYPIQCLMSVAKDEITALRLAYREYERVCRFRVYYDCPSEPLQREAVCRNNRCEVELHTLDPLRDETLEYLGIDPQPGRGNVRP